ncbi:hypothetical protein P9112_014400 [Eukaryota sp. TZLM1-RC]
MSGCVSISTNQFCYLHQQKLHLTSCDYDPQRQLPYVTSSSSSIISFNPTTLLHHSFYTSSMLFIHNKTQISWIDLSSPHLTLSTPIHPKITIPKGFSDFITLQLGSSPILTFLSEGEILFQQLHESSPRVFPLFASTSASNVRCRMHQLSSNQVLVNTVDGDLILLKFTMGFNDKNRIKIEKFGLNVDGFEIGYGDLFSKYSNCGQNIRHYSRSSSVLQVLTLRNNQISISVTHQPIKIPVISEKPIKLIDISSDIILVVFDAFVFLCSLSLSFCIELELDGSVDGFSILSFKNGNFGTCLNNGNFEFFNLSNVWDRYSGIFDLNVLIKRAQDGLSKLRQNFSVSNFDDVNQWIELIVQDVLSNLSGIPEFFEQRIAKYNENLNNQAEQLAQIRKELNVDFTSKFDTICEKQQELEERISALDHESFKFLPESEWRSLKRSIQKFRSHLDFYREQFDLSNERLCCYTNYLNQENELKKMVSMLSIGKLQEKESCLSAFCHESRHQSK